MLCFVVAFLGSDNFPLREVANEDISNIQKDNNSKTE